MANSSHRIVIVGGGAGGLELACQLGRRMGKGDKAEIVLVDASLVHVWKPLYHEVAAGTLDSQEDAINYLAQAYRSHFTFQYGRMNGLDRQRKQIHLAAVVDERGDEIVPERDIPYDTLVIAIGSVANHFGIPGAEEYCLHLDDLQEAEAFHRRLTHILLRAQADPKARGKLSIAIIGAGATGVELAAELRGAAKRAVHYGLKQLDPVRDLKLTIIEGNDRILPPLPEKLAGKTAIELRKLHVEVITGERVTKVTPDGVHTNNDRFIPAELKVWAAGIKAPELLRELDGLETTRGDQLLVRRTLQTTRDDSIFAFGDCAFCPQPDSDRPVPPRAQAASQQAAFLARSLERYLEGKPLEEYLYHDRGSLISLSAGQQAVGRLMGGVIRGLMIEGMLARVAYQSLYKKHLAALYGWFATGVMTVGVWLTRPVKSRLKLH